MITIQSTNKPIYYIVRSENFSVIHYGIVEIGQILNSGQPFSDQFDSRDGLIKRLEELEVDFDVNLIR